MVEGVCWSVSLPSSASPVHLFVWYHDSFHLTLKVQASFCEIINYNICRLETFLEEDC
jgi:hypothetical protein